jgi:DNA-directed RNA polymerase subunit RPC12/RpoP
MDIVFNCPHCEQELAVDSAGAGSEIECPECHETITIPAASKKTAAAPPTPPSESQSPSPVSGAMHTSAAAKVEKHLKVPVSDKPAEILIKKPAVPLGAKTTGEKQIRIHTIKHASCVESGHDKFDEVVTAFLQQIGEANMVAMHTISYTCFDVGTQKILNDYGVIVLYHG